MSHHPLFSLFRRCLDAEVSRSSSTGSNTGSSVEPVPAPLLTQQATNLHLMQAAVYIEFPNHANPARRSFLEPQVSVTSSTPYLGDLIRTLRNLQSPVGIILNEICSGLATNSFHVAWSRTLVEVHDASYSSLATGYREVGALRHQLQESNVVLDPAPSGLASIPHDQHLAPAAAGPSQTRSRSQTPVPAVAHAQFLRSVLKVSKALDARYSQDGARLHDLLGHGYGAAYLQIWQALIIEGVYTQAKSDPTLSGLTIRDVAAWAGLKPKTYLNNRTLATNARATLQWLRARVGSPDTMALSPDLVKKEKNLREFLGKCFSPELLAGDWRNAESSEENLKVGDATASGLVEMIRSFDAAVKPYKK
ncbi:hypothetical protein B0H17DRAFT_1155277 [Mycena rosella]|uniref:Uncharacterized protein n=1 Tax=Mycena rosella TaxID=1033263 RepID=A0AAD7AWF9_MYCRO|nr:hypothetical protein B0H17DRAFT_1155277 [Mycena rosella]